MKSFRPDRYTQAGIFFLLLQIGITAYNLSAGRYHVLAWFCNHAPMFFGVAFLIRNKTLINALINFGLLGQLVWVLDFLFMLAGIEVLGVTSYVFEEEIYSFLFQSMIHFLGVGLALLFTYSDRPTVKELRYSATYTIMLYLFSLLFADLNVNCVSYICGMPDLTPPHYTLLWPFLIFAILVLPTHGIRHLLHRWLGKNRT